MMAMRSLQPPCIRNREPKANEPDGHEDHPRNEAMIYAVAGHLGLTPDLVGEVITGDARVKRSPLSTLLDSQSRAPLPFSHNGAGDGGVRIGRMVRAVNVGFYRFGSVPHVLRNILGTVHNATCKMARNRPNSPKAQARNVSRLSDIMRRFLFDGIRPA